MSRSTATPPDGSHVAGWSGPCAAVGTAQDVRRNGRSCDRRDRDVRPQSERPRAGASRARSRAGARPRGAAQTSGASADSAAVRSAGTEDDRDRSREAARRSLSAPHDPPGAGASRGGRLQHAPPPPRPRRPQTGCQGARRRTCSASLLRGGCDRATTGSRLCLRIAPGAASASAGPCDSKRAVASRSAGSSPRGAGSGRRGAECREAPGGSGPGRRPPRAART